MILNSTHYIITNLNQTREEMSENCETLSLNEIIQKGVKLTPMMEQYHEMKKQYPDILLMFRMGDFYELFFEDAKIASKILNISLTHRGKLGGYPIPMSGIPHHAASTYVDRISSMGKKVAICEQIEDPKLAKGIVKRAVTQVVSPGMPFDLDKNESSEHNYMACAYKSHESYYLILIDYTTGDFFGLSLSSIDEIINKLQIFRPKEFICALGQWDESPIMKTYLERSSTLTTNLSEEYFSEKYSGLYVEKLIPTYKRDQVIKLHKNILAPIGALSYYICSTQPLENISHMRPFQVIALKNDMKITFPTLVGLEIFPRSKEQYKDSILGHIDVTKTTMGSRKLKTLFQSPLRDLELIQKRLDTVEYLLSDLDVLKTVRSKLSHIRDIERIMAKVSTGKVNGPDLINLAAANKSYLEILNMLKKMPRIILDKIEEDEALLLKNIEQNISETFSDEIGATLEKGSLIKPGHNKERDRLANLSYNAAESLIKLETKYRKETGITTLKIKSNNVAGYFIEVSKSQSAKVSASFIRRQTLVNSERYHTPELADFEKEIISAKDKLYKLERKIFDDVVQTVKSASIQILKLAHNISLIDVFQSFAWVSFQDGFTRPHIKNKKIVDIKQGWHPLIKKSLRDQFVNHDIFLDKKTYFALITGPNMAGKTTVMREVAIIQFLMQVGCFVPAESATLGLTDYIFSRLGASDDIIKGQSTFMVEMSETAEIIRHATQDSLIILDEIGRGTSTYDGLSIAWSLVEHFVEQTRALTLFSTHYHELIELAHKMPSAKNLTVKTINENGTVQFLYQLIEEGATQSFGIHVAKLAGLPQKILTRSSEILTRLETESTSTQVVNLATNTNKNQLDMFSQIPQIIYEEVKSPILKDLEELDIINMTPLEAITRLHDLKERSQAHEI